MSQSAPFISVSSERNKNAGVLLRGRSSRGAAQMERVSDKVCGSFPFTRRISNCKREREPVAHLLLQTKIHSMPCMEMSLVCNYDTFDDGSLCHNLVPLSSRYDSSLTTNDSLCEVHCNSLFDCAGFIVEYDATREKSECWISLNGLPMGSSNATVGEALGSCHVKIQNSCRVIDSRDLEKCRGACISNVLLVIPGLIIYAIIGFFLLCFLCCLPCICVEICRPSPAQCKIADARAKAHAEGVENPDEDHAHHRLNSKDVEVGAEDLVEVEMVANAGDEQGTEYSIPPPKARTLLRDGIPDKPSFSI